MCVLHSLVIFVFWNILQSHPVIVTNYLKENLNIFIM